MRVWTHNFASALAARPNRRVLAFVLGRLVIIWDSKR